ncbi:M55 family metallopeptidase [bacterium]|nr:M55 family metallopeptidase [candidate division CSSED10-310 bacterium]
MAETKKNKVFISVDIEGVTGVVHWDETESGKPDYGFFRKVMAAETNSAVEAAYEWGATDVYVRDAHGSALNILPDMLHKNARLIRNWGNTPFCMMEGLDQSFRAVIFIGYHAKAGTPDSPLKHTMTTRISDLKLNGESLAEAGFNALIAGQFDVPVVFLSGDKAICRYTRKLIPGIETVSVKEGLGGAFITQHPDVSVEQIKSGVLRGLRKRETIRPLKFRPPFEMDVTYSREEYAFRAAWYPGVKRLGDCSVRYRSRSFPDCLKFFYFTEPSD